MSHSNPYEEYLEATREAPLVTLGKHIARYSLTRFTSTIFSYPWEAMIILRQVQHSEGNLNEQNLKVIDAEKSVEEQRVEYERYLLNPTAATLHSIPVRQKDEEGYIHSPMTPSRLQLDLKKSVMHSMYSSVQLEGIYGLYQGCGAYNAKKIFSDVLHDGIVPIVWSGMSDDSIIHEAVVTAVSAVVLNPFEVAHTKLTVQSPYHAEKTFHNGIYSVLRQSKWSELFSGVFYNTLGRLSEVVGTAVISRYGCALVDRLRVNSYYWLTTGYFFVNLLAMNIPLMLSVPCDTIRRRLAVSGMRSTRVPVRPDWPISEQLRYRQSLYHGLLFRIATNTAFLIINFMTEMEAEWLGHGSDDF